MEQISYFRLSLDYFSIIKFFLKSIGKSKKYKLVIDKLIFLLRKNTSDFYVVKEIFNKKIYGEKPNGIIFDIGANIGAYTLYSALKAERIFAFEPENSNYEILKENIAMNNIKNVKTFKKAIGDQKRNAVLYLGVNNKGMGSTSIMTSLKTEVVEMISLEDAINLCEVEHIDTLKIDIEGGEYQLIESTPSFVFKKIKKIVMEYHHIPKSKKGVKILVNRLKKEGYNITIKQKITSILSGTGIILAIKK